jgi:hypothetical protein
MPLRQRFPICPVCSEPVQLTSAVTNEEGKAVHEECYVETVNGKARTKAPTFSATIFSQISLLLNFIRSLPAKARPN